MATIVLDTNFLMIPSALGVDIISEIDRICSFRYDLAIVDKTKDELLGITKNQRGKHKEAAKVALSVIENNNINIIATSSDGDADMAILSLADERGADMIVATQDSELKKKLRSKGVRLIVLRQKKYLKIE